MGFPGFDGLRLLAALGVLMSHAFIIPGAAESSDLLVRTLGRIGYYGVFTFFVISGFLLSRSLAREPDALRFAVNRVLRIYPGLLACVVVTALVLGALGTALPWRDYLAHGDLRTYVLLTMNCLCAKGWLPGVFDYARFDELQTVVNGSLWSLSYEVLSYLVLLALWLALRDMRWVIAALVTLAVGTLLLPSVHEGLAGIAFTLPYFAAGAAMFAIHRRFGLHAGVAAACAAALAAGAWLDAPGLSYATFGAYVVTYLGTRPNIGSTFAARIGDLSYGIYLYGWPVQQLVKQATGTTDPWLMLALSAPAAALLALLSHRYVERPALRLKEPVTAWLRRSFAGAEAGPCAVVRAGATSGFLVACVVVLWAPDALWWFVTASVAGVAAATLLGASLGAVAVTIRRWHGARRA